MRDLDPKFLPLGWAIPVPKRSQAPGKPTSNLLPPCFSRGWHHSLVLCTLNPLLLLNRDFLPGCRGKNEGRSVWGWGWGCFDRQQEAIQRSTSGSQSRGSSKMRVKIPRFEPSHWKEAAVLLLKSAGQDWEGQLFGDKLMSCSQFGDMGGELLNWR